MATNEFTKSFNTDNDSQNKIIVGIDFGSDKSVTYISDNGMIKIIPDPMDYRSMKNRIRFSKDLDIVRTIGNSVPASKNQLLNNSDTCVINIGKKKYSIPKYFIQSMVMTQILRNISRKSNPESKHNDRSIRYMISLANNISFSDKRLLETSINHLLHIDHQIDKTLISYVSDSLALAKHYTDTHYKEHVLFHAKNPRRPYNILIIDMGYTKTTYIHLSSKADCGKNPVFTVEKVLNHGFGARDIDEGLVGYVVMRLRKQVPRISDKILNKIKDGVEKIKKQLSQLDTVIMTLETEDRDYKININRDKLLEYCDQKDMIHNPLAGLTEFDQIDRIEFVGGNHRFGPIYDRFVNTIQDNFTKVPKICKTMDGDESVAKGCISLADSTVSRLYRKVRDPVQISYLDQNKETKSDVYNAGQLVNCEGSVTHVMIPIVSEFKVWFGPNYYRVSLSGDGLSSNKKLRIGMMMGLDNIPIVTMIAGSGQSVDYRIIEMNHCIINYINIEKKIRRLESLVSRRSDIKNYLEQFHYRRHDIDKLLIDSKSRKYQDLKDFQEFCCVFTDDPYYGSDDQLTRDKIDDILESKDGVKKMERAILAVKKILGER